MEPDRLLLDSNSQQELFVCAPLLFSAIEQFWQLSFILCPFSCCSLIHARNFQPIPEAWDIVLANSVKSCCSCVKQMIWSWTRVFQRKGEERTTTGEGDTKNTNHQAKQIWFSDWKLNQQEFEEPLIWNSCFHADSRQQVRSCGPARRSLPDEPGALWLLLPSRDFPPHVTVK